MAAFGSSELKRGNAVKDRKISPSKRPSLIYFNKLMLNRSSGAS
jgi:hypothetical protein